MLQSFVFLAISWFWDIQPPVIGYLTVLPALILSSLMFGSLGLFLSSLIRQLENFSGVMNFIIFPMFFMSSALYPLWRMKESSLFLFKICELNPFTYAVELMRYALYARFNAQACLVVACCALIFLLTAVYAYNPSKGMMTRKDR